MKIKDVEKQVGISKANIRFYEEEGLIHPARNQENNYREYSEADVEQLQEIKKLRLIGIPVQEIKEIYEDRLTLQEALSRRLDEIEKELGIATCPINWPIGSGKNFKGVYDRNTKKVMTFSDRYVWQFF